MQSQMDPGVEKSGWPGRRVGAADLAEHSGWLLALGTLSACVGAAAIVAPGLATIAVEQFIGALFLVEGVVGATHAFRLRKWCRTSWRLLGSGLSMAAGLILLANPLAGILSLTMLVGVLFTVSGLARLHLAWQLFPLRSWEWLAFHGVLSVFLGSLIVFGWPWAVPGMLGLLVGINLMFDGWWLITLSLIARAEVP